MERAVSVDHSDRRRCPMPSHQHLALNPLAEILGEGVELRPQLGVVAVAGCQ
jgi:hypothetical protein